MIHVLQIIQNKLLQLMPSSGVIETYSKNLGGVSAFSFQSILLFTANIAIKLGICFALVYAAIRLVEHKRLRKAP